MIYGKNWSNINSRAFHYVKKSFLMHLFQFCTISIFLAISVDGRTPRGKWVKICEITNKRHLSRGGYNPILIKFGQFSKFLALFVEESVPWVKWVKICNITKGRHLSRGGYNQILIKFGQFSTFWASSVEESIIGHLIW